MKIKSLFIIALVSFISLISASNSYAQGGDNTAPQLVSLAFSPTSIDTSNSSQTVTFTMRVTDDVSGVGNGDVYLTFRSPSGNNQVTNRAYLISGDSFDGVYQGILTFPRYSETGTYSASVTLYDVVRNYRQINTAELDSRGFPSTLQVSGTQSDTTPPQLVSLDFNPKSINTNNSSQTVTFTMRVTDDISGVGDGDVYLTFRNSSSNSQVANRAYLISGNSLDGIYQGTITFPQASAAGTYNASVTLYDVVRNYRQIETGELGSRGFPTSVFVNQTPTAATVLIGGKVTNSNGRGIFRAIVKLTDTNGNLRIAYTNPFGYYRFSNVAAGNNYVLEVNHRNYTFTPRVLFIGEEYLNLNFTVAEAK